MKCVIQPPLFFLRNMAQHSLIDVHSIMRAPFIVPLVPLMFVSTIDIYQ